MEIVFAPAVISLKDPTIRTVLRRLEDKGYVTHSVVSGTFIYRATDSAEAAASAVQGIVDGYCGGSLERVLRGLVASRLSSEKSNASTPPLERDREQPYMEAPALKLEAAATGGMDRRIPHRQSRKEFFTI
jgi:predicted transcriptional regulator